MYSFFRCVHASLYEVVSVCLLVGRSVGPSVCEYGPEELGPGPSLSLSLHVLVHMSVLVLAMSNTYAGELVFNDLAFTETLLDKLYIFVDTSFSACEIDVVHMLGCSKVVLEFELWVVLSWLHADKLRRFLEFE